MVAELHVRGDWRRPGCDARCRVVRAIQPGVMGRVEIESHDPDAHEDFGYSLAGTGTIRRRSEVRAGPLVVDLSLRTATLDGEPVRVSGREWDLLEYLARQPGRFCPIRELLGAVWGTPWTGEADAHLVRSTVGRLRARLGAAHGLIETRHGVGFRLVAMPPCGVRDLPPAPTKRIPGWSRDHERCRACGTTDRPHWAHGLCRSCRDRRRNRGLPLTDGGAS